jgi:hypothetical protein
MIVVPHDIGHRAALMGLTGPAALGSLSDPIPEAEHARAFLLDAADLLAEPDPGPTRWLLEGLIVDQALAAAVGRWKTTKSFAMLEAAASSATGTPAFGSVPVPEPGPVVLSST